MRTYIIEKKTDNGHDVLGYYHYLRDAKDDLRDGETILKLEGDYFGEGWHKYRLIKIGLNKYRRLTDSWDISEN